VSFLSKIFPDALVDSSFTRFLTWRVATVLSVIVMILLALAEVASVLAGVFLLQNAISRRHQSALAFSVGDPRAALLTLASVRFVFESAVALVLIAEKISKKVS